MKRTVLKTDENGQPLLQAALTTRTGSHHGTCHAQTLELHPATLSRAYAGQPIGTAFKRAIGRVFPDQVASFVVDQEETEAQT